MTHETWVVFSKCFLISEITLFPQQLYKMGEDKNRLTRFMNTGTGSERLRYLPKDPQHVSHRTSSRIHLSGSGYFFGVTLESNSEFKWMDLLPK